jgi:hypothetical protein
LGFNQKSACQTVRRGTIEIGSTQRRYLPMMTSVALIMTVTTVDASTLTTTSAITDPRSFR